MAFSDNKSHQSSIIAALNSNRRIFLISIILLIPLTSYLQEIFSTISGNSNATDPYQINLPLFKAVKANKLNDVNALLQSTTSYDPNAEDPEGITPLIEATLLGNYEMVSFLISKGAKAQPSPGFRHTALRAACLTGNRQLITYLLQNGADPNAKSDGDRTPLMGACFLRPEYDKLPNAREISLKAVQLMLGDGRTDPLIVNSFGESALDLCKQRGYVESVAYLEEKIKSKQQ
jgi:ankyrin repeat protein